MELFERVIRAMEGEGDPKTWQTERGPVVVRRACFVDWTLRIEQTFTLTALDCIVLINFKLGDFSTSDERRIVDAWSKALLHAAKSGGVRPRDPVTLLPMDEIPEDWAGWGISLTDADKFVAEMGMTWTITSLTEHMVEEANGALLHEHELLTGARGATIKPRTETAKSAAKLDWKQMARSYATTTWDTRRAGSNPSKAMIAESVRKKFESEGVYGPRGPLSKDNILREALNIWKKPISPIKRAGVP